MAFSTRLLAIAITVTTTIAVAGSVMAALPATVVLTDFEPVVVRESTNQPPASGNMGNAFFVLENGTGQTITQVLFTLEAIDIDQGFDPVFVDILDTGATFLQDPLTNDGFLQTETIAFFLDGTSTAKVLWEAPGSIPDGAGFDVGINVFHNEQVRFTAQVGNGLLEIPEPTSLALLLLGVLFAHRRRSTQLRTLTTATST